MISILYVEDEPFLAKIVKETLESNDFLIHHAKNGVEGEKLFKEKKIQLCVLDIMLPGKNGYELAKEIRSIDSQIPIIFLTAKNQTKDLIKGFESGGNDYLKKPFSMEELIVRIKNLVNMSTLLKEEPAVYIINSEVKFIHNNMELLIGHSTKKLSHKENEILKTLCKHINEVVDRRELLKHVWGDDTYYNSRTLDVYITKLRNIFKEKPTIKIQTLKGVGYKFLVN
jgi:DNA-binding response OmpR family regulator